MTGDFEDSSFCGEYGTFPIYNWVCHRGNHLWKEAQQHPGELPSWRGYRTGEMPDITVISALGRAGSSARERWSVSGVVFTEAALANIEAKKAVERELPFKAVLAKNLEAIE